MDNEHFNKLIEHYIHQTATAEEQQELSDWYDSENNRDIIWPSISEDEEKIVDQRIFSKILFHTQPTRNRFKRIWKPFTIAASIAIVIAAGGFYFYQTNHTKSIQISAKNDIAPGGNKAFLTLADGKRIVLTDAKNGELAEQSGVKITKATDGQLIYTVSNVSNENNKKTYNIIETPRGGTYQVRLPDGTKVWLNAASTLRFPSSFARLVNRRVELLSGEAYFEVAKDKKHPFIVQTDQQEVKVLGTHFNINSYSDEFFTKTTLLEGSVLISPLEKDGTRGKSKLLKPTQQAVLKGKSLEVINADVEEAVAWKSGYFKFHNERIESVMKKIARWYNIKVQYDGMIPTEGLGGTMSREQNLSKVLDMLQSTGLVKFKINGDLVTVSK